MDKACTYCDFLSPECEFGCFLEDFVDELANAGTTSVASIIGTMGEENEC